MTSTRSLVRVYAGLVDTAWLHLYVQPPSAPVWTRLPRNKSTNRASRHPPLLGLIAATGGSMTVIYMHRRRLAVEGSALRKTQQPTTKQEARLRERTARHCGWHSFANSGCACTIYSGDGRLWFCLMCIDGTSIMPLLSGEEGQGRPRPCSVEDRGRDMMWLGQDVSGGQRLIRRLHPVACRYRNGEFGVDERSRVVHSWVSFLLGPDFSAWCS